MVSKEHIFRDIDFYWKSSNKNNINTSISVIYSPKKIEFTADVVCILTEWEEFKKIDFSKTIVFDGRGVAAKSNYSIGKG